MTYKRNTDVVKRSVAGEAFLIPVRNRLADMRNIYVLHGVGEFIWDRLGADMESLIGGLMEHFDVDRSLAEQDLQEYLNELKNAGLVCAEG